MLTRSDIARLIGVSRELFRKTVEPRPDFPRPALRLSRKTVLWDEPEVMRWLQRERGKA